MKKIWAPWRIKYILGKKSEKCIFCINKTAGYKKRHLILTGSKHSFVIMNKYPYTVGHLMVVPHRHISGLDKMDEEELTDFFLLLRFSINALSKAMNPDGINVGANLGEAAGAGVKEHLHFHIVARWNGDHNFMPVMNDTMIISEQLEKTYERLLPFFEKHV